MHIVGHLRRVRPRGAVDEAGKLAFGILELIADPTDRLDAWRRTYLRAVRVTLQHRLHSHRASLRGRNGIGRIVA